jgi:hypothetical protein
MPLHSVTHHDTSTPVHGSITFSHDTATGAITVEFERLETADAVLPRYSLGLSTEHVAAWAGHVLRERWGRRCKEITGRHDGRRFATALRLTQADSGLVYYTHNAEGVVVLRGGRVLKVPLRVEEGMGQFEGRLGEMAREDRQDVSVAAEFVEYVGAMVG